MNSNELANEIRYQIRSIESAAFGMGHKPNAGQQARIDALQAQLSEVEG